ncbi:MAG TPA: hypothetical protein VIJ94_06505, partial [Caulobacteraceae bacterium]
LILLVWCALPATAVASTYGIVPVPAPGLMVRYNHGVPILVSVGRHGAIQIAPVTSRTNGRLRFSVVGYNGSEQPANLGYEDLSLTLAEVSNPPLQFRSAQP